MNVSDGMNYAPQGKPQPVVKPGEFVFSAAHIDHGHIYGMCNGLTEAGGTIKYVYDPDPKKVENFLKVYPQARPARSLEEVLDDRETQMVCSSHVTSERGPLGVRVMKAGKDYFSDKAPFTTMDQLNAARETVAQTGRKYMVYYSERLHVEGAILAGYMIDQGEIGRVISVNGFGPHRLGAAGRPKWFFEREKYGGILCDIGSHQIEQYLHFSGEEDATVQFSRIGNYAHPEYPELEDYGDCSILGEKGTTNYFRVDWFTPDGLRTWGDGRTFILGTEGFIEIRKYINLATDTVDGNHVFLVNGKGEKYVNATGVTGYPFFGQLILDCLNRTENAMTQTHAFKAAELCLMAQQKAVWTQKP
ncbi:MAG: Gfo/Idh/MocA family oxidoreductase [Clostridia bacterium]|nr:Gfo/Idh/MocA family oxidoreductase [Clostridia bacterium]